MGVAFRGRAARSAGWPVMQTAEKAGRRNCLPHGRQISSLRTAGGRLSACRLTSSAACIACLLAGGALAQQDKLAQTGEPTTTFGTTVVIPSGLRGDIYYILPSSWKLPNFEKLKPVGSIYTTSLNIPSQSFTIGFPGVTNRFEWFAIDYRGKFWIQHPDTYRFALRSDDGSRLYIDDKLLINNDGIHAPTTEYGKVDLAGGIHSIRVSYFQGPREMVALILAVARGKDPEWRVFNTNQFRPPVNPRDWKYGDGPGAGLRNDDAGPDAVALAVLGTTPLPHDFDFRVAVPSFGYSSGKRQGALVLELPANVLTATPDAGRQTSRVHVSLLALVKDERGAVADRFSLDAPYEVPSDKLAEVQASLITYTHPLRLPAGRYTVEAAMIDHEGRRSSARVIEFASLEPRRGVEISSVILVQRVQPAGASPDAADPFVYQGNRVSPLISTTLSASMKPAVYFVVYPDKTNAEKPKVRVEFLTGGQTLANQTAELPPPDASGAIPVVVGAAMRPGDCELRITAIQGADSATESVRYTVPQ